MLALQDDSAAARVSASRKESQKEKWLIKNMYETFLY